MELALDIAFQTAPLPRNASGKVMKHVLADAINRMPDRERLMAEPVPFVEAVRTRWTP